MRYSSRTVEKPLSEKPPFVYRAPTVRWVDYARRSWQRLGHLKIACALANSSTGTTLEGLTSRFEAVVTSLQGVPEPTRTQVWNYIRSFRPNRYPRDGQGAGQVELQDLYLSDPNLPSHSGAITGDMGASGYRHAVYVEIPAWAVRLRLLRRENYTITDRGKALACLRPGQPEHIRSYDPVRNPFNLSLGERYFFLYCLLDADGDLIQRIFSSLLILQGPVTRSKIGEIAAEALQALSAERLRLGASGRSQIIANRISATVQSVEKQKGTGMGPRESLATPRTEPLVDCGLLSRADPTSYAYLLTQQGRDFVTEMVKSTTLDQFIYTKLAGRTAHLIDLDVDPDKVRRFVARSYARLRSGLGYCSIREVALLAVALALDECASCAFELRDAELEISEAGRHYGKEVRFTKSRQGDIALVRISPRVVAELTNE
jgi:hypothetical protein